VQKLADHLSTVGNALLRGLCSMGLATMGIASSEAVKALRDLNVEAEARRGVRKCERYLASR
jgi:hypothetical protein